MTILKMMNLTKELTLTIECDTCSESPREWENLGTFYTWENSNISPDNNRFKNGVEFFESILGYELTQRIHAKYTNTADFMAEMVERMDNLGYVLFPVAKYEHSGVSYFLGTASGWDYGTVGVIFAEKKKIYEWLQVKRITSKVAERVERIFEGELNVYTQWCNGEVYGYIVEDLQGNELDSVWGFYDDMYNEVKAVEVVSGHFDIGDSDDWETYDEEKIDDMFEIVTTIKRKSGGK